MAATKPDEGLVERIARESAEGKFETPPRPEPSKALEEAWEAYVRTVLPETSDATHARFAFYAGAGVVIGELSRESGAIVDGNSALGRLRTEFFAHLAALHAAAAEGRRT